MDRVQSFLERQDLKYLSNCFHALKKSMTGDGCGMRGGAILDDFLGEYFEGAKEYQEYHVGEADLKLCGIPLSLKSSMRGDGSTFALDWSKNETDTQRESFGCDILILITQGGAWWKRDNKVVRAGFYLVPKEFCRENVSLSSNNKTNRLISKPEVYKMLQGASHFVPLPEPDDGAVRYSVMRGFRRVDEGVILDGMADRELAALGGRVLEEITRRRGTPCTT